MTCLQRCAKNSASWGCFDIVLLLLVSLFVILGLDPRIHSASPLTMDPRVVHEDDSGGEFSP